MRGVKNFARKSERESEPKSERREREGWSDRVKREKGKGGVKDRQTEMKRGGEKEDEKESDVRKGHVYTRPGRICTSKTYIYNPAKTQKSENSNQARVLN